MDWIKELELETESIITENRSILNSLDRSNNKKLKMLCDQVLLPILDIKGEN